MISREDFARALAMSLDENNKNPDIPIEGKLENMRERCARYQRWLVHGCAFKPGELVTPVKGCKYSDHGEPHIVLEVRERAPEPLMSIGDAGSSSFGSRLDVRVLFRTRDDHYPMFWMESVELEPWTPPNQD